jgi:hypothetical protein
LDDFENILQNNALHISEPTPRALAATLFGEPTADISSNQKLYRPLACLTFGLNWYAGQTNVWGYHLVNVGIHLLTAFFLFITILSLYRTPGMQKRPEGEAYFVGLLAVVLWAVNPIQTQAVTYIVQRMASMAAMFYVLGLFCYLTARQSKGKIRQARKRHHLPPGPLIVGSHFFSGLQREKKQADLAGCVRWGHPGPDGSGDLAIAVGRAVEDPQRL